MFRTLFIIAMLASACTVQAFAVRAAEKLPVDAFSKEEDISLLKLSPDGEKMAFLIPYKGRNAILIQSLQAKPLGLLPAPDNSNIENFFWGNDQVIIIRIGNTIQRNYFRNKTSETRAYSYHLKTKEMVWLGKPKRQKLGKNKDLIYTSQHEQIIDFLPNDPDHILLELDFELDAASSIYKVNIVTGKKKVFKRQREGIQNWYTDSNSEVRLGTGYLDAEFQSNSEFKIVFKNPDGKWTDLKRTEWYDNYDFEGFTTDQNLIYVRGPTKYGTNGLFTLNINTGKIVDQLFAHPDVDMGYVLDHPITNKPAGVGYITNLWYRQYFDKDLAKIQRSIAQALNSENTALVSAAKDKALYVFLVRNETNPGDYYLYDRTSKQLHYLMPKRKAIQPEQMGTVLSINIPTRDDDEMPSYITIPQGIEKPEKLPTIIMPHGGPHARASAHWSYWSQFYANRGYLVVRPNFRGSKGFGNDYYNKGVLQWGGLMQDDVTDATKWVIDQGYADPEKICIVGWSYGGYAALMGPIKEPELYKCAISVNGVTNIPLMKSRDKRYIGGKNWIKRMGHEGKDDKEVSPQHRVNELKIPVMLIATKDDARVPYKHSRQMHNALKKNGVESEYLLFKEGGHSMYTPENRKQMLEATEKFLAKHLGK